MKIKKIKNHLPYCSDRVITSMPEFFRQYCTPQSSRTLVILLRYCCCNSLLLTGKANALISSHFCIAGALMIKCSEALRGAFYLSVY